MSASPSITRQAVIVIHGIGEQRPMDTLRDFAKSVAPLNEDPSKPAFFSKPDQFSDSYELRRLTANRQKNTYKTDYFEFYWAHLMSGTQVKDIIWWVWNMFVRLPKQIPKRLRWIYYLFWTTLVTTLASLILIQVYVGIMIPKPLRDFFTTGWVKTISSLIVATISGVINGLLLNYLGDAVRYFSPLPGNVAARQQIRKAGISLLRRLHDQEGTKGHNLYDRIIVVGHSLGSVIAYDILCLFWNEVGSNLDLDPSDIDQIELAASDLNNKNIDLERFREAQFQFWLSQYKKTHSWRVSDFITAGSPLAFADLHIAKDAAEMDLKTKQREFPVCPPATEPPTSSQLKKLSNKNKLEWFSFPASDDGRAKRTLHHAAIFSMTRWTNLFFRNDYVGGPITNLGSGIENKELVSQTHSIAPFVSHTHYWDPREEVSLKFLKSKMQLTFASLKILDDKETEIE